jgi:hypothetical protein
MTGSRAIRAAPATVTAAATPSAAAWPLVNSAKTATSNGPATCTTSNSDVSAANAADRIG